MAEQTDSNTTPDPKAELEAILENTKKQTENIQSQLDKVNKIVAVIEDYDKNFDSLRKKIDEANSGLQQNFTASQVSKNDIDKLLQSSRESLNEISTNSNTVKQNVEQMQNTYRDFVAIKAKVEDGSTGLEAVLKECQNKKDHIEQLRVASEQTLNQIKSNLETLNSQIQTMQSAFEEFTKIKAKIDDEQSGLQAVLTNSQGLEQDIAAVKNQSETLYKQIKLLSDESQQANRDITKVARTQFFVRVVYSVMDS